MPVFAAVDIGANSVRLKIASLSGRRLSPILEDREVTRLGESVFRTGLLEPHAMAHAVKVLGRFHRAAQQHGADRVRVVATSALRDARNASAFVEWVRSTTGWEVEVISGLEEGRLIHLGVVAAKSVRVSPMLLIDLGGGSCELTVSNHGTIEHIVSLPLGAVRLTRDFLQSDPPRKRELKGLSAFIAEEISRAEEQLNPSRVKMTVATSGTAAALADMWAARLGKRSATVPRAGLLEMAQELATLSLPERRALPGIGTRRAEIIIAGSFVYAELLTRLRLSSFRYLPLGLRDGLLAEMAAEQDARVSLRARLEQERQASVVALLEHYDGDRKHADRVRDLSQQLFRGLKSVHGLPPAYEQWISAAAMLQETGSFINRAGRHRHAYYVIAHSEIFGFTVRQRHLIAAIARYMGKSRPAANSRPVRLLDPQDRALLPRAVLLLRMARALEQGRRGAVKGITVRAEEGRVTVNVKARPSGAELEIWALRRERAYFRSVFGRDLLCAES